MIKLTEYREQLGFTDTKTSRNFADWLRDARTEHVYTKIDNELAYEPEFVRDVLRDKIRLIESKYPNQYISVCHYIGIEPKTENHEHVQQTIKTESATITTEQMEIDIETKPDVGTNRIADEPVPVERMETETKPIRTEPETAETGNPVTESKFRRILTNPETLLWGTFAAIMIFLPFTVLNLYQYISIETTSAAGDWGVFLLCCGIAFVWDFSILLFAINGKQTMSKIGAGVLFVFMASKFDFFARIFNAIGVDGDSVQLMLVITAIVFYSPILIHQYTKLSIKNESE